MEKRLERVDEIDRLLDKRKDLRPLALELQAAFDLLKNGFARGGKLLLCGNGGSAADCEHIVGELMKGFNSRRPLPLEMRAKLAAVDPREGPYLAELLQGALPAISLVSQAGLMSAFANDVDPDLVFAQQVLGYGREGDRLIAISTSGSSSNVLYAVQTARALGLKTLGLTGRCGGRLKDLCDVAICAPYDDTSEIQEAHIAIYHALCAQLEREFFA